ncbi:hypothetical protein [Nitrolancea hollandica]|nr:hypothetical protein [Nitrolancea hollandica]
MEPHEPEHDPTEPPEPEQDPELAARRRRGGQQVLLVVVIAYALLGLMCVIAGVLIAIRVSS